MNSRKVLSLAKHHIPYLLVLLILVLIVFFDFANDSTSLRRNDMIQYLARGWFLQNSIKDAGDYTPLWDPFMVSGTPFYITPGYGFGAFDSMLGFPNLLFRPVLALKITYLLSIYLAGVFMYILIFYVTRSSFAGFISSLVFMFNGFLFKVFQWGWGTTISTYFHTPFIILFTILACKKKQWTIYSIITGIVFSHQLHSGTDLKVFMWDMLIFGLYLGFFIIGKDIRVRIVKVGLIGIIVGLVVFGLSAEKILPIKEYLSESSRASLSFEDSSTRRLRISEIPTRLIEPVYEGMPKIRRPGTGDQIGIIAFILSCIGIYYSRKKKIVWYLIAVAVLSILIASGSFVYYILWKFVPPFDHARYVDRSLVIFIFAMACLAGIGFSNFENLLKSKYKFNKKKLFYIFLIISSLVFLNLAVFGYSPYRTWLKEWNIYDMIEQNQIHQYIKNQPGIFRMQTLETKGVDWGTNFLTTPLKIEQIYGHAVAWLPEYFNEFLSFANRDPARYWGILNVRYATSTKDINDSNFEFVKMFEKCTVCFPDTPELDKINGPYLYKNLKEVPRAYMVDNVILVAGEKNAAKQLMYGIMAQPGFDPLKTVIILREGVLSNDERDILKNVRSIVLAPGSVDQSSGFILQDFVGSGGIIIPDITKGENTISQEKIDDLIETMNNETKTAFVPDDKISRIKYSKQRVYIGDHGTSWLVLSELYSITPGWGAVSDKGDLVPLMRANGVVTAVPIDEDIDQVVFEYLPKSYVLGRWINLVSLVLIVSFFCYHFIKQRKKNE